MIEETREDGIKAISAATAADWRAWLENHHAGETAVWVIFFKTNSGTPSVQYSEAVDEALCFGWIDSKPNKRDAHSYYRYFSKRNPKSSWSRVNKQKVQKLIAANKMAPAGLQMVEQAKKLGSWTALDAIENLEIPTDLQQALEADPAALKHFSAFPRSSMRNILEWIATAKRPETRSKRIAITVELAAQNLRANHYRQPKN